MVAFTTLALVSMLPAAARLEPVAGTGERPLAIAPRADLPGFTLPNLAGAPLRLDDQRGRVVLVHFFATWCEPCREELASLSRLVQVTCANRVTVLAVNVAEVPARVRRFLDAAPVSFPVVLDADRAVTRAWGVGVLPTTFVLDTTLRPRLFVEGDLDWSRADILSVLDEVGRPQQVTPQTLAHP
jgi:peroxiredoxin